MSHIIRNNNREKVIGIYNRTRDALRENIIRATAVYVTFVGVNVLFIIDWNTLVGFILAAISLSYMFICIEEIDKIKKGE